MEFFELKLGAASCRLCGSTEDQKEFFPERYVRAGQSIRRCGYCSFVYLAPDFTDQALDAFYKKSYKQLFPAEYIGEKVENFFKYRADDYYAKKRLNFVNNYIPIGGKLFEFGSGFGNFMNQVGIYRPDIKKYANEPDQLNRNKSITNTTINFLDTSECTLFTEYFDMIVAFHVLEHVVDPSDFIRIAKNMLKYNGYLIIEVPNMMLGSGSQKYFHAAHLSYFTENTLKGLLQSMELEINYCGVSPDGGVSDAIWAVAKKTVAAIKPIELANIDDIIAVDNKLNSFRWSFFDKLKEEVKKFLILLVGVSVYGIILRRVRFYLKI